MTAAKPLTCDVERLWRGTTPRPHLTRPSAGTTDVLLAVAGTGAPECGSEIARRLGHARPPVYRRLRNLRTFGFIEIDFVIQARTGARPAEFWTLTERGRELVGALRAEMSVATLDGLPA